MVTKAKTAYFIFIEDTKNGIDDFTLADFERAIGDNEADHLYLIMESRGGSPFSAVSMMNILDTRFAKISTIVPRYAKSAATLMALGTDEIYMSSRSALGPLDLQIEHHRDGSRISALDIRNTVTSMAALVESISQSRYDLLREREISSLDSSRLSLQNATEFLEPIVKQVDLYHLQKAERQLKIGLLYAIKLLSRRMMKNQTKMAEETAKELVNNFPSHDYCIYSDDAKKKLHLDIKNMEDNPFWISTIKPKYDTVSSKIYHMEYGIIEKNVEHIEEPTENHPIQPTQ